MERTCPKLAAMVVLAASLSAILITSAIAEVVITQPIRQFGYGTLEEAAYSPDGRYIATCGSMGAYLWDAQTSMFVRAIRGHADVVRSIAFSPDGARLLTGSSDNTARIWDVATGVCTRVFHFAWGYSNAVFSPDGTSVLAVLNSGRGVLPTIFDADTGALIRTFDAKFCGCVAFSPDGRSVVTGSSKTAKVFSVGTGECLLTISGHTETVNSVALSPDGSRILTGSWDDTAKLWNAGTGELLRTFSGHANIETVAFSPDGTTVLTASIDRTAKLWSLAGTCILTLTGHTSHVMSASFSPDGSLVLTASLDGTARLWDTSGSVLQILGNSLYHSKITLSPDGTRFLEAGFLEASKKNAELWDAGSGFLVNTYAGHTGTVYSGAFSPDGTRVATASSDKTAKLWNTLGGCIRTFTGHTGTVNAVAFSPDASRLLTGSGDKTAKLWSIETGACIRTLTGSNAYITSVAYSPDGTRVVTGSGSDGFSGPKARLYDVETGSCLRTFSGQSQQINSITFSPDGAYVLTGSDDDTAKLWDMGTGTCIQTFSHLNDVNAAAFSLDGTRIVTASRDKTTKLWDVATGMCLRTYREKASVISAAFMPDGKRIITSAGGCIKIWSMNPVLHVQSAPTPGVAISGDCPGTADYSIELEEDRIVNLTAPETASFWGNERDFVRWFIDGEPQPAGQQTIQVAMDLPHIALAAYETHQLTVQSTPLGAEMAGDKPGTTDYTATCYGGQGVSLTAPAGAKLGGLQHRFVKWLVDGAEHYDPTRRDIYLIMDSDHTATAIYELQPYTLTVQAISTKEWEWPIPTVSIAGSLPGTAPYSATCLDQQEVTLVAPDSVSQETGTIVGEFIFVQWKLDSRLQPEGQTAVQFKMPAYRTATAIYRQMLYVSISHYTPGLESGTREHPFGSVQAAADVALDDAAIVIDDGTYTEDVTWAGKSIELSGNGPSTRVINGTVTINCAESVTMPDGSVYSDYPCPGKLTAAGLTVTGTITCAGSYANLTNCAVGGILDIHGNTCNLMGFFGMWDDLCEIRNCTLAEVTAAGAAVTIENCIVLPGGITADAIPYEETGFWPLPSHFDISHSCLSGGRNSVVYICRFNPWGIDWDMYVCGEIVFGPGNIYVDPLLADPANGDYHLKSQHGRWDPATQSWSLDDVTSPCIDAGDPASEYSNEPQPNFARINMGAYGNTPEASKSGWTIPGDATDDCRVNVLDLIHVRNRFGQAVSSGDNWRFDVNKDNAIDVLDLITVRNLLGTQCQ